MSRLATVDHAELDWEADGTPRSRQFQDVYFSRDGGLAESTYVYLHGNQLPARWPRHFEQHNAFQLFEAGFGTGLNFLLTCRAFLHQAGSATQKLRYVAAECFPLRRDDLEKALSFFPKLADYTQALLTVYPPALRGWHQCMLFDQRVELILLLDDIGNSLPALSKTDWRFDAWYLDGFAPARNEAMWAERLWPAIGQLSRTGATASTFSAAGTVRRGLQQAGFTVQKIAGFGRKRDMTIALFNGSTALEMSHPAAENNAASATSVTQSKRATTANTVTIIGAGIAGAATARALAEHGIAVTVLEQQEDAGGTLRQHALALASPRWSRDHNVRSRLQLSGFLQLRHWAQTLRDPLGETIVHHDRVLTLLDDDEVARELQVLQELGLLNHFAHWLSAEQTQVAAGLALHCQSIQHSLALAVAPAPLCRALLQHPNITVRTRARVSQLQTDANGSQLHLQDGSMLTAEQIVLATGVDVMTWLPRLPLRPVRGQSTTLPASETSAALKLPLRFGGYLTPAQQGCHVLGASYDGGVFDPQLRAESQQQNLANLARVLPELAAASNDLPVQGDVGHRLVTPDRAPLIGAHPLHAGVWLNLAHGSHALMTACAGAQLLAAQFCSVPPSMPGDIIRAVNPARFRSYFDAT